MNKTKTTIASLIAAATLLVGCGGLTTGVGTGTTQAGDASATGSIIGGILGAITNGEGLGNAISSVIGLDKLSKRTIIGTWSYQGPGCAFTSENALAKAGGEVTATQIEEKLQPQYDRLGFNRQNTYITFAEDGNFSAKINSKSWSGKWTLDEKTGALNLKGLLLSVNGYAKRNGLSGISVLFESKKLLQLFQVMAALSGNQAIETVGEISKNYDGVRLGFDLDK